MTPVGRSLAALLLLAVVPTGRGLAAGTGGVPEPVMRAGDSWVFDQTIQRGTTGFGEVKLDMNVERVDGDTMVVGLKRDGAPGAAQDHVVGTDWSQRRIIDGQETTTTHPLNFPLSPGQSWTVDFVDPTVRGRQTSLHFHQTYRVTGWSDVTTPAGTFHALLIEAHGVDKATLQVPNSVVGGAMSAPDGGATVTRSQRGGQTTITRALHGEFYYVPAVKTWVKSLEEQYNTDDVLIGRDTRVLLSYKLAA